MKETVQSGSSNLPYTLFIDKDYDAGTFINGDYTLGPSADVDLLYDVLDVIREVDELAAYHQIQTIMPGMNTSVQAIS